MAAEDASGAATRDAGGVAIVGEDLSEESIITLEPRVDPIVKPRDALATKPKSTLGEQTGKRKGIKDGSCLATRSTVVLAPEVIKKNRQRQDQT